MMNTPVALSLWHDSSVIGAVRDPFHSDDTWYGVLDRTIKPIGEAASRLIQFIEFCEDWNDRNLADPEHPPDPAEFDRFSDLIESELWVIKGGDGMDAQILKAPVFFASGEITWRGVASAKSKGGA